MRMRNIFPDSKDEGEVIAVWGEAKLVKYLDGGLGLKGGSRDDRVAARKCGGFATDTRAESLSLIEKEKPPGQREENSKTRCNNVNPASCQSGFLLKKSKSAI